MKDFANLLNELNKTNKILGKYEKTKSEAILSARNNFLRYLVASKDLESGKVLEFTDFEVKRVTPGDLGVQPLSLTE